jgi:hypothetical protein
MPNTPKKEIKSTPFTPLQDLGVKLATATSAGAVAGLALANNSEFAVRHPVAAPITGLLVGGASGFATALAHQRGIVVGREQERSRNAHMITGIEESRK